MGLLDDLSMGLGLKDRDEDYYDRTAKTLGRTQGGAREAQYRQSSGFGEPGRQGLLSGSSMGKYRDMNDMFDGGGPMARGGRYEGGGLISFLANLANAVAGRDMGQTVGYGAPMEATIKPKPRVMPTSTYDAERMMEINDPMGSSLFARSDNPSVSAMGYGTANAPANKVADVASALNTAKTTAAQDELLSMAQNLVASENPTYNSTMPREEKMARVQQKYNELAISLGM
jgi:hypothetical protein